ncbi:glycosyltransferase [candidate division KSB1 bacterium]
MIISAGVYTLFSILLIAGVIVRDKKCLDITPDVSIIIPARNEEKNLKRCLESLEKLNYPKEKLEIIIVNDHSTDNTCKIAESFCERNGHFSLLNLSDHTEAEKGKISALKAGFSNTQGEIVLQTDADCRVQPDWVNAMISRFKENTGIVGGVTLIETKNKINACFGYLQSLDWLYLIGVGAGAYRIGIPLSSFGNNIAIRRMAYSDAGGYEKIPFTFTEDFAIFRNIIKSGWKASYSLENNSVVQSLSPENIKSFINQRLRWTAGGIKLAGMGVLLLLSAFILHILVPAGLLLNDITGLSLKIFSLTFLLDLIFLSVLSLKTKRAGLLLIFPVFELYYYLYTTVLGLIFPFSTTLSWKERKYD